jgi:hypothetical protein
LVWFNFDEFFFYIPTNDYLYAKFHWLRSFHRFIVALVILKIGTNAQMFYFLLNPILLHIFLNSSLWFFVYMRREITLVIFVELYWKTALTHFKTIIPTRTTNELKYTIYLYVQCNLQFSMPRGLNKTTIIYSVCFYLEYVS